MDTFLFSLSTIATIVIAIWAVKSHNLAKAIKDSSDIDRQRFIELLKTLTLAQLSIVNAPGQSTRSNVNHFKQLRKDHLEELFGE